MTSPTDPKSTDQSTKKEQLPVPEKEPLKSAPPGGSPPDDGYLSFGERGRQVAAERKARGLAPKPSAAAKRGPTEHEEHLVAPGKLKKPSH